MPKKQKAVETTEVPQDVLLPILKGIQDSINKLSEAIVKPITSQAEALKVDDNVVHSEQRVFVATTVPQEFRDLVNTALNKDFGVEIEPHDDPQLMILTIVVPPKYSQMTPTQLEMMHRDIRPKVISRAGGINEAKEWVETIYKHLTPETQAAIAADRLRG